LHAGGLGLRRDEFAKLRTDGDTLGDFQKCRSAQTSPPPSVLIWLLSMKHVARDIASAEIRAAGAVRRLRGSQLLDWIGVHRRRRPPARPSARLQPATVTRQITISLPRRRSQNSLFRVDGLFDLASVLMGGKLPEPRSGELPIRDYLPGSAARANF